MMATPKRIKLDPESEFIRLLQDAANEPTIIEAGGEKFRVIRETSDIFANYDADLAIAALRGIFDTLPSEGASERAELFANYDPERARAAVDQMFGALRDEDLQSLKEELRELREQDSTGRPA